MKWPLYLLTIIALMSTWGSYASTGSAWTWCLVTYLHNNLSKDWILWCSCVKQKNMLLTTIITYISKYSLNAQVKQSKSRQLASVKWCSLFVRTVLVFLQMLWMLFTSLFVGRSTTFAKRSFSMILLKTCYSVKIVFSLAIRSNLRVCINMTER